ncbi:MAG: AAA family ATPase [Myxococcales bacterium]|nr:AAA family ATPase [Myxococcales bacterium]MCB9521175.1 AAA family ATPase [Myxococcales bacterium]MCB9530533.1 AAA family ATPase [Myxococcales bacterium]
MRSFLRSGIKRLVASQRQARPLGDRAAVVIAVAARKGGVGKTTTSVNLAAALARFHARRVLLVDLDPQGHVGASMSAQFHGSAVGLSGVFTEDSDVDVMDTVVPTDAERLHITSGDRTLAAAELALTSRIGKEFVLHEALEVARTHYDVILLDCPPNVGNLTLNALVAADLVLVPCDLSPLAVDGVHALIETVSTISDRLNPKIDLLGIVVTRLDARNTGLNESVLAELRDSYGVLVFDETIGINTDLAKAQRAGKNVFDHAPQSRGAQHHRSLADAVLARLSA